ncbi:hypothetical protein TNCV_5122251 [Trichonephila clavipes]|nr:hypothetical protein TNCV_5122251 [Trichonephila clavipes]
MVKKKDGSSRTCINYRKLNEKLVKDKFPLPFMEDVLDTLQEAKGRDSPNGARPTVPTSVYVTLGPEMHKQMFWSGGESDAKSSLFSSQAHLVLIYRPTEGMSQPCPALGLNLGPVVWKRGPCIVLENQILPLHPK